MLKKIFAAVLLLALLVSCFYKPIVVKAEVTPTYEFKYNTIIDEILLLDKSVDKSRNELYVVSVPKQGTTEKKLSSDENTELAIQTVSQKDDVTEVTTFYPYKITENGNLINSFEYTPKNTRDTDTYNFNLVDTVVAVTIYYNHEFSLINMTNYYRHLGVRAAWSSNNTQVSVSKLEVEFESYGDLHRYPDCMTQSQYQSLVEQDCRIKSTISKTNPYNGQICVSLDPMMPENRMLDFADGMWHGGLVSINVNYSVNGVARSYAHQYNAYI